MITQYEVHSLLADELPQLTMKRYPSRVSLDIYASINYFTDCTKQALEEHDFNQAKKCLVLAENLYLNGDQMVRCLIENSFIYFFSSFMSHSATEMFMLKSILPETLYRVYKKQNKRMNTTN